MSVVTKTFYLFRDGDELDTVKISLSPHWLSKPYFRLPDSVKQQMIPEGEKSYKEKRKEELMLKSQELGISIKSVFFLDFNFCCFRQAKKREKRKIMQEKILICKKSKFPPCQRCTQPAGQGCKQNMCKRCCKYISKQQRLDCNCEFASFCTFEASHENTYYNFQLIEQSGLTYPHWNRTLF